nr:hypothetical protein [Tanacetum cinerariifolium]
MVFDSLSGFCGGPRGGVIGGGGGGGRPGRPRSPRRPRRIHGGGGGGGSRWISIFTVNAYVSLGCSGTTWIMRRTLDISLTFHTLSGFCGGPRGGVIGGGGGGGRPGRPRSPRRPRRIHGGGGGGGSRWLVLSNQSIKVAISPVCASSKSSGGGRSSSRGFHQSCLKFTLGIWALPTSSSSDDSACSSRAISSSIYRSAGVNEIDGLSLMLVVVEVVVAALRRIQKLLKLQMVLLVEEEEVANEVETQVAFLVTRDSFSSSCMLQPSLLRVLQSDHGSSTSLKLHIATCDLYEICKIRFPT